MVEELGEKLKGKAEVVTCMVKASPTFWRCSFFSLDLYMARACTVMALIRGMTESLFCTKQLSEDWCGSISNALIRWRHKLLFVLYFFYNSYTPH